MKKVQISQFPEKRAVCPNLYHIFCSYLIYICWIYDACCLVGGCMFSPSFFPVLTPRSDERFSSHSAKTTNIFLITARVSVIKVCIFKQQLTSFCMCHSCQSHSENHGPRGLSLELTEGQVAFLMTCHLCAIQDTLKVQRCFVHSLTGHLGRDCA